MDWAYTCKYTFGGNQAFVAFSDGFIDDIDVYRQNPDSGKWEEVKMTVSDGAELIRVISESDELNDESARTTAEGLSKDPAFNLAAYLKFSFGCVLAGMTDEDWMTEATTIEKIVNWIYR